MSSVRAQTDGAAHSEKYEVIDMKGFKPSKNKGMSGARKRQKAAGDHSVSKVKQKKGACAKESSMGFAGNKIIEVDHR